MDYINALCQFLYERGYRKIKTGKEEWDCFLWAKDMDREICLVEIVPERLPGQSRIPVNKQEERIRQVENQLILRYGKKVDRITLMLFRGTPEERTVEEICRYPNIWCIDKIRGRLLIYENQRTDFHGLQSGLELWIAAFAAEMRKNGRMEFRRMLTPVNTALAAVNILVFMFLSFTGNVMDAGFMAEHGAMYWDAIVEKNEVWRLFTSCFMHFGIEHLLQNMLILLLIGSRLERITGSIRYLILYLGSGIAASVASLFFTLAREPYTVSAGASGAIFGIMGGLLFMILKYLIHKKRRRIQEIGASGMIFVIVAALSYGFTTTGVDNAAHVGGLIAGFIFTGILAIRK